MREMEVLNPETGLTEVQQIPKDKLDEIEALVASAIESMRSAATA